MLNGSATGVLNIALSDEEKAAYGKLSEREQYDFMNERENTRAISWINGELEKAKRFVGLPEEGSSKEIKEAVKKFKAIAYMLDHEIGLEFVEGRFLKAYRNGNLILLDEVNLANEEMLGVLYQVLTQGYLKYGKQVIRPEKGKIPRIMATANPSSYSGRKRLSEAFMNRFEIINLDAMTSDEMAEIVEMELAEKGYSLESLKIKPNKDLPKEKVKGEKEKIYISQLADVAESLNWLLDAGHFSGMGEDRDYRFTLRNIKRIAADVIERMEAGEAVTRDTWIREAYLEFSGVLLRTNIYEFDQNAVEYIIIKNVFTNKMDISEQEFDKITSDNFKQIKADFSHEDHIELDGLITGKERGPKEINNIGKLVEVESTRMTMIAICKAIRQNVPTLLVGQSGGGKTEIIGDIANRLNRKYVSVSLGDATLESLIGTMEYDSREGRFVYREGVLVKAMREGAILVLEELNMAKSGVLEVLNEYFDNGTFTNPYTHKEVEIDKENFRLFATMNPVAGVSGKNAGRVKLSPALRNRFREIWVPHEKNETETKKIIEVTFTREIERLASGSGITLAPGDINAIYVLYKKFKEQFGKRGEEIFYTSLREPVRLVRFMAYYMCELNMDKGLAFERAAGRVYRNRLHSPEDIEQLLTILKGSDCGILGAEGFRHGEISFDLGASELKAYEQIGGEKILVARINKETISSKLNDKDLKLLSESKLVEDDRTKQNILSLIEAFSQDAEKNGAGKFTPVFLMGGTSGGKSSIARYAALNLLGQHFTRIQINEQTDEMDLFGAYEPIEVKIGFDEAYNIVKNAMAENKWVKLRQAAKILKSGGLGVDDIDDAFDEVSLTENMSKRAIETQKTITKHLIRALQKETSEEKEEAKKYIVNIAHLMKNGILNIELRFREGRLLSAMRRGDFVTLDEVNLANEESLGVIYQLLTLGYVEYYDQIEGRVTKITPAPGFKLVATANPLYAGRNKLSEAFMNRFEVHYIADMSPEVMSGIVEEEFSAKCDDAGSKFSKITMRDREKANGIIKKLSYFQKTLNDELEKNHFADIRGVQIDPKSGYTFTLRNLKKIMRDVEEVFHEGDSSPPVQEAIIKEAYLEYLGILGRSNKNTELLNKLFSENVGAVPGLKELNFKITADAVSINGLSVEKRQGEEASAMADVIEPLIEVSSTNLIRYQVLKGIQDKKRACLLVGQSGGGKTEIIGDLARELRWKYRSVSLGNASLDTLLGSYIMDENTKRFKYKPGILVQAMREGAILVLEEINMADSGLLEILNEYFDEGTFTNPFTGEQEEIHRNFRLFATMNPEQGVTSRSGGRVGLSPALRSRFSEVWVPHGKSEEEIKKIIRGKFKNRGIEKNIEKAIDRIYKAYSNYTGLMENNKYGAKNNEGYYTSLRDITRIADIVARSILLTSTAKESTETDIDGFVDHALYRVYYLRNHSAEDKQLVTEKVFNKGKNEPQTSVKWEETPDQYKAYLLGKLIGSIEKNELDGFVMTEESKKIIGDILDGFYRRKGDKMDSRFNPIMLFGETAGGKSTYAEIAAKMIGKSFKRIQINQRTDEYDLLGSSHPVTEKYNLKDSFEILTRAFKQGRNVQIEKAFKRMNITDNEIKKALGGQFSEATKYYDYIFSFLVPKANSEMKKAVSGNAAMPEAGAFRKLQKMAVLLESGFGGINLTFRDGEFLKAFRAGDVVLLDEVNLANEEALAILYQVLTLGYIEFNGEQIKPGAGFQLIVTANPASYAGRNRMSEAFMNRFEMHHIRTASPEECCEILENKYKTENVIKKELILKLARMQKIIDEKSHNGDFEVFNNNGTYNFAIRNLERIIEDTLKRLQSPGQTKNDEQILTEEAYAEYAGLVGQSEKNIKLLGDIFKEHLAGDLNYEEIYPSYRLNITDDNVNMNDISVQKRTNETTDADSVRKMIEFRSMRYVRSQILKGFRDGARIKDKHVSRPVLLVGQSGGGKTDMIGDIARELRWKYESVSLGAATVETLVGSYILDEETGTFVFKKGVLVRAMEEGAALVLEEINMSDAGVIEILNQYFDTGRFVIPDTGEEIRIHDDFRLFATMNPLAGVIGTNTGRVGLSPALRSRFREIWVDHARGKDEKYRILINIAKDKIGKISDEDLGANVEWFYERVDSKERIGFMYGAQLPNYMAQPGSSVHMAKPQGRQPVSARSTVGIRSKKKIDFWSPAITKSWKEKSIEEKKQLYKAAFAAVSPGGISLEAGKGWAYNSFNNVLYYPEEELEKCSLKALVFAAMHESMHRYGDRYTLIYAEQMRDGLECDISNVIRDGRIENWARYLFGGAANYLVRGNTEIIFGRGMVGYYREHPQEGEEMVEDAENEISQDGELVKVLFGNNANYLQTVRNFLIFMGKRGFIPGNEKNVALSMELIRKTKEELFIDLYKILIGTHTVEKLLKENALPDVEELMLGKGKTVERAKQILGKDDSYDFIGNGMLGTGREDDVLRKGTRGVFSLIPIRKDANNKIEFNRMPTEEEIMDLAFEQGENIRENIMPIVYKWAVESKDQSDDDKNEDKETPEEDKDGKRQRGNKPGQGNGKTEAGEPDKGGKKPDAGEPDKDKGTPERGRGESEPEKGKGEPEAGGPDMGGEKPDAGKPDKDKGTPEIGTGESGPEKGEEESAGDGAGNAKPTKPGIFNKDKAKWKTLSKEDQKKILDKINDEVGKQIGDKTMNGAKDFQEANEEALLAGDMSECRKIMQEIRRYVTELMGYLDSIITDTIRPKKAYVKRGGVIDGRRLMKSLGAALSDGMKFYRKNLDPTKKNISFTLIMDESGSMEGIKGYNALKGGVLFAETLEALG
ncbi:MAG: AAA family ATPase, partial [Candidatus Omnitrophica bacterium]|nr:AAA family ATPase [Candidatus Omnitrophota bacterium]